MFPFSTLDKQFSFRAQDARLKITASNHERTNERTKEQSKKKKRF